MQRRLAVAADPVQDLLVGGDRRPGRELPAVEGRERGLAQDVPRDPDRLDPLAPVGVGGQVVEPQRRVDGRVGRDDPDRAAGVGVHRADVHLVAVTAGRRRAVVPDRDRQEVEHQVRVRHVVVGPGEAAALEMVRRAGAGPPEQPLGADHRPVAPLQRGRHRDRLLAGVLDVDLEVILQVLADARQVGDHVDAVLAQQAGRADAGELEQLRRVDRPAAQDDLAGADLLRLTAAARRPGLRCRYSTPTARLPSNRILVTNARVSARSGSGGSSPDAGRRGRPTAACRGRWSGRRRRSLPAGTRSRPWSARIPLAAPPRRTR